MDSNNKVVSHEEFLTQLKNKKIRVVYDVKEIDVIEIISGRKKDILKFITFVLSILPPLLIIIFTIVSFKWYLLIALPIYWVATVIAQMYSLKSFFKNVISSLATNGIFGLLVILPIVFLVRNKFVFYDSFTFFSLTFYFSFLLSLLEKTIAYYFLIDFLTNDEYGYYANIDKILIEKREH